MAISKVIKDANVTISIRGLALSHYNEGRNRWETRFLRHISGHNLKLIVKKNSEQIFAGDIEKNERISIVTNRAKPLSPRYQEGDNYDLSHLVDFNSTRMCGNKFKFKQMPMTLLSTADACFYTKKRSRKQYTVRKNEDDVFTGRVGIITGGDIVALDQTEIIFSTSPAKNLTLPAETGVFYEIILDNDCLNPPPDGSCDFDRYNDVIETTDKYTLRSPDVQGYMDPEEDEEEEEDEHKDPPCLNGLGGDSPDV
jgi:hypothetical protein